MINKKKYLVIGVIMIVAALLGTYELDRSNNNIETQTDIIMSHVPADCYSFFPHKNDTNIADAQVVYYQSVVDGINKTGVKYMGSFLRSPAFTEWLFNNCPVYNATTLIYNQKQFNSSDALVSERIKPSFVLQQKVTEEQKMFDYNYNDNSNHFSRIEYIAINFNQTLQSTIDNLFLSGGLNMDDKKQCVNPSWRLDSVIRQCTMYNSTFVVNKNNQDLMTILDKPIKGLNIH